MGNHQGLLAAWQLQIKAHFSMFACVDPSCWLICIIIFFIINSILMNYSNLKAVLSNAYHFYSTFASKQPSIKGIDFNRKSKPFAYLKKRKIDTISEWKSMEYYINRSAVLSITHDFPVIFLMLGHPQPFAIPLIFSNPCGIDIDLELQRKIQTNSVFI